MEIGTKFDMNMNVNEIAKAIRKDIAAEKKSNPLFKGAKISVRIKKYSGGQRITVKVKECCFNPMNPERVQADKDSADINYNISVYNAKGQGMAEKLKAITEAYNYDKSDSQSDYFNVNFYSYVNFDYDLEKAFIEEIEENLKTALEIHRQEILDAAPVCEICGAKIMEKPWEAGEHACLCWDCYHPMQEAIRQAEIVKFQAEEAIRQAEIAKLDGAFSVSVPERNIQIRLPRGNKRDTIDQYLSQLDNNYNVVNAQITERVSLTSEQYDIFCQNLLADFDWLEGKGGYNEDVISAIEITGADRPTIYVGPEGYSYARYVGFPMTEEDTAPAEPQSLAEFTDAELMAELNRRSQKNEPPKLTVVK